MNDIDNMMTALAEKYGENHENISSFERFSRTPFASENPEFIRIVFDSLMDRPHQKSE